MLWAILHLYHPFPTFSILATSMSPARTTVPVCKSNVQFGSPEGVPLSLLTDIQRYLSVPALAYILADIFAPFRAVDAIEKTL